MKKFIWLAILIPFLTAGCGSPPIVHRLDPEIDRNATAAKSAYSSGSMESASVFYQKALDRARLADQPREISRLAYNLAACRTQMQKYDEALELLDEAEFECSAIGIDFPEARLLRAEIVRYQGKTNEALAIAGEGMDALKNQKNHPCNIQFHLLLAELACDRNDGAQALKELDKIDRPSLPEAASVIQARAADARGRALFIDKRPAEAAICFDNAAGLYQKAWQYSDMAKALHSAGTAYEAADKRQEAFNRYYRAARSMFLYGDNLRAQESFNKAGELAKKSNNKQMLNALKRLKDEIRPNAENKSPSAKTQTK